MAAPLKLISHKLCPYVQRAVIALTEKDTAFERIDIDLANKPDWFLKVSPLGKTPVLMVGEHAIFRYELTAVGDSTHLVVTYKRISMHTARGFLPGLHAFLDRLEAQLGGTKMPGFGERFGELRAEYPEWSHAPASGQ